jgi:hypothetical protein
MMMPAHPEVNMAYHSGVRPSTNPVEPALMAFRVGYRVTGSDTVGGVSNTIRDPPLPPLSLRLCWQSTNKPRDGQGHVPRT